jgi:hypothetical protein
MREERWVIGKVADFLTQIEGDHSMSDRMRSSASDPLGRAFASKGANWGRRQARALLAITAPISCCWLVPTNGAPASCT